jgi:hypothetical protein
MPVPEEEEILDLTDTEKEVLSVINSRFKLGRERYGIGVSFDMHKEDDRDYDAISWITEAIEECSDLLTYLVATRKFLIAVKEKRGSS